MLRDYCDICGNDIQDYFETGAIELDQYCDLCQIKIDEIVKKSQNSAVERDGHGQQLPLQPLEIILKLLETRLANYEESSKSPEGKNKVIFGKMIELNDIILRVKELMK